MRGRSHYSSVHSTGPVVQTLHVVCVSIDHCALLAAERQEKKTNKKTWLAKNSFEERVGGPIQTASAQDQNKYVHSELIRGSPHKKTPTTFQCLQQTMSHFGSFHVNHDSRQVIFCGPAGLTVDK